jgi:hypothetical protein
MNLPDRIYAHAKALPPDLQRATLDFIEHLEQRHGVAPLVTRIPNTDAFIARFAGSLGEDFPDEIDDSDLGADAPRESLE